MEGEDMERARKPKQDAGAIEAAKRLFVASGTSKEAIERVLSRG